MPQHPQFAVVPEDQWKPCPRCGQPVPQLTLPESLTREIDAIGKKSPIDIIKRLCQDGLTLKVANTWVHHHLQFCKGRGPATSTTPCPCCGKFLRTPNAKQCRFCGADWHDKV